MPYYMKWDVQPTAGLGTGQYGDWNRRFPVKQLKVRRGRVRMIRAQCMADECRATATERLCKRLDSQFQAVEAL